MLPSPPSRGPWLVVATVVIIVCLQQCTAAPFDKGHPSNIKGADTDWIMLACFQQPGRGEVGVGDCGGGDDEDVHVGVFVAGCSCGDGPAAWEFSTGKESWSNTTAEESQCEVYARGGELRGRIRGSGPNFDSPLFMLNATDHYYAVIRMNYHGFSTQGRVLVRFGDFLPPSSYVCFRSSRGMRVLHFVLHAHCTRRRTHADAECFAIRYATGDAVWDENVGDFLSLDFDIIGDGFFHTYYVPMYDFREPIPVVQHQITQLRLYPALNAALGQSVAIDFIRVVEAPTIFAVQGCSQLPLHATGPGIYPPPVGEQWIRPPTPLNQYFSRFNETSVTRGVGVDDDSLPFGITYNCLIEGGDRITVKGINLGISGARIAVNNRPCLDVEHITDQTAVSCTLPPGVPGIVDVTIAEGFMPGLTGTKAFLSYMSACSSCALPPVTTACMYCCLTVVSLCVPPPQSLPRVCLNPPSRTLLQSLFT